MCQQEVLTKVKEILSSEDWFVGVCLDNFPSDDECRNNFDDAVKSVCFETAMWDDPHFYGNTTK